MDSVVIGDTMKMHNTYNKCRYSTVRYSYCTGEVRHTLCFTDIV